MKELTNLDLSAVRECLDSGRASSRELVSAYLARIESNPHLNAFTEVLGESALSEADAADRKIRAGERAPLLGIPVAVKDIILVKGHKNTCSSRILQGFVSPYDATVTEKLRQAGAIVIGKTNMDEFAMGSSSESSAFGPVRNPWDRERVPGGSSGGSAAAVAARLAPLALGTDTGGSIRQPAAFCNLVGLKPTYGRVSRYGVVAFASSLDQVGGFARTVSDCALLSQTIFGHDPRDSTSVERPVPDLVSAIRRGDLTGLKIGVPKEYFIKGLSQDTEQAVRKAIAKLEELGARAVEVSLPNTEAAVAVYYILAPAEASSNLARYDGIRYGHRASQPHDLKDLYCRTRSDGFGREVKRRIMIGTYVLSSGYYDAYYLRAQKVRALIAQDFARAFDGQCDLIACPTAPTTAFKLGEKTEDPVEMYLNDVFTIPVNLAGLPGTSLPCGFDGSGLPIGLQLIGKPWDEETILRAAHAYQSATDWHTKLPPL